MKPIRVLVFSTTFGAGHVKAAEAIIEELKFLEPETEIIHEDAIALINRYFNTFIRSTYIRVIKRAPKIWGQLYNHARELSPDSLLQRANKKFGRKQLLHYILIQKPDVIISTYPTVSGVLAELRIRGQLSIPLVSVITDFSVHNQWVHPGVDLNIVGCSKVYNGIMARGIDPKRIEVTGIPVDPKFEADVNRDEVLSKFGLKRDYLTFLIMGGAYGVLDKLQWICKYIQNINAPIQSIIVCGKDKRLYDSLDNVIKDANNPVVRFGYVDNIHEIMTAADIMITKAGGLTVSEGLAKHLPMIIFKPIPGQEEDNARYLEEVGAGRIVRNNEEFISFINDIISNPSIINEMRQAAIKATPGSSAKRAVEAILTLFTL